MTASTVTLSSTVSATPIVFEGPHYIGVPKIASKTIEVATTSLDETNDRVLFLYLPSNTRIFSLWLYNDDLDSNGTPALTMDIGLFYGGGQVISGVLKSEGDELDDDCFATIITTCQSANTAGVQVLAEAMDIAKIGKPLWEIGGLSTDPGGLLCIGTSVGTAAATAAAGTVTLVATVA